MINRIIKPCISTYVAMLNVFPVLFILYCFIFFECLDFQTFLILFILFCYISFILILLKTNSIVISHDSITLFQLHKKKIVKLSDIIRVKKKSAIKTKPNRIELVFLNKHEKEDTLVIRTKWYDIDDIKYLHTIIESVPVRPGITH